MPKKCLDQQVVALFEEHKSHWVNFCWQFIRQRYACLEIEKEELVGYVYLWFVELLRKFDAENSKLSFNQFIFLHLRWKISDLWRCKYSKNVLQNYVKLDVLTENQMRYSDDFVEHDWKINYCRNVHQMYGEIKQLPELHQKVLHYKIDNVNNLKIAQLLGINVKKVANLYEAAKKMLRANLKICLAK